MRYLRNTSTNPHYNMAFDEFCLEQLSLDEPVFYLWQNAPAVIIGLNQNAYNEVNLSYLKEKGIVLARRVTGGGAVYHDLQNLNYTIVGRSHDLEADYPGYMRMVINALCSMGVDAQLSGRNDIMVDGRKVSGYAKRVYKDRLMVHGTLMFNVDLEDLTRALAVPGSKLETAGIASVRSRVANLRDYMPQFSDIHDFQTELERILSRDNADSLVELSEEELSVISSMSETKFATWDWVFGHSPEASRRDRRKFACGTVEVQVCVKHGCISELVFSGDFMGNLPAEELAAIIKGSHFEKDAVLERLSLVDVSSYFDKATASDLAGLICG